MFDSEINGYKKKEKKDNPKEDEESLEIYLKERYAAIGEKTKSLKESKEERAMQEYIKLRERAYGKEKVKLEMEDDFEGDEDIDTYIKERNTAMKDDVARKDNDDELDAYIRKRKQVMDD